MEKIKGIDCLYYPFTPEQQERFWSSEEMQIMLKNIIGGRIPKGYGGRCSAEEFIAIMDKYGLEKCLIAACKFWSYRNRRMSVEFSNEEVYELVKKFPERLIGLAGYNPYRIKESLEEIKRAVNDYGFKGVYGHFMGFGLAPNDKKLYPLYAKCVELDIPVSMQVGHAAEVLPSEPGRPIYLDEVAIDFPSLRIIGSHTGWPWCEEMIAMAWKHENVYVDIAGHHPRFLDKSIVDFMNTRGKNKTLFGTNGWAYEMILPAFEQLGLKEESMRLVLRENAMKVYKL
jgi:hypothetical protein